ncbi:MAG: hypothetical protein HOW73_48060 [Polyangiaceae bacterium]|nr:hypothetical protein [Polyangiaceae bacterium]
MKRRALLIGGGVLAVGAISGVWLLTRGAFEFPPDDKPEGAYLRIAHALTEGDPKVLFDYIEDPARDAIFTLHDFRKRSSDLVSANFPEPDRARLLAEYEKVASAPDGYALFSTLADERGWIGRLRKDLSGIAEVQIEGERATIVTARGTRYSFRKRGAGMWGLTMFTAELVMDANRAARDFDVVRRAAEDYAAGK